MDSEVTLRKYSNIYTADNQYICPLILTLCIGK